MDVIRLEYNNYNLSSEDWKQKCIKIQKNSIGFSVQASLPYIYTTIASIHTIATLISNTCDIYKV